MFNGNLRKLVSVTFIFIIILVLCGLLGASHSLQLDKGVEESFIAGLGASIVGILFIAKQHYIDCKQEKLLKIKEQQTKIKPLPKKFKIKKIN